MLDCDRIQFLLQLTFWSEPADAFKPEIIYFIAFNLPHKLIHETYVMNSIKLNNLLKIVKQRKSEFTTEYTETIGRIYYSQRHGYVI